VRKIDATPGQKQKDKGGGGGGGGEGGGGGGEEEDAEKSGVGNGLDEKLVKRRKGAS
jgi:hypothetical protein